MRRIALLTLLFWITVVFAGCGGGSSTDKLPGAQPPPDQTVASLAFSDPNNTNFSARTSDSPIRLGVTASNAAGDDLNGVTITLTTDLGELDDLNGLTGSVIEVTTADGSAAFNFKSGTNKANGSGTLSAIVGAISVDQAVSLTGSTLTLEPSGFSISPSGTQTITATALDAGGSAITSEFITISSAKQGELANDLPDTNGELAISYTAGTSSAIDTISASGFGATASIQANVTDQAFVFESPANGTEIPRNGTQSIVFRSSDDTGAAVENEQLEFFATFGTFTGGTNILTVSPGSDGRATVTYEAPASPTQNETITVTSIVSGVRGTSTDLSLAIVSLEPASLTLTANPEIVATNSQSTLTATVKDNGGFAVEGSEVQLQILTSPGDVSLSPYPRITTNSNGQATSTFTSGSTTTSADGVSILARIANNPSISAQVNLTIGQQNAQIGLSPANVPEISGTAGYSLAIQVTVTDANSNPVTDQIVSLSMFPLRFRTGSWLDPNDTTVIIPASTGVFPNEDINRSGTLDTGEDGAFGLYDLNHDGSYTGETAYYHDFGDVSATLIPANLNGELDPGVVGSITSQVTTGSTGTAEATISYSKEMGRWIDVEVTASTTVSGNTITKTKSFTLPILPSDVPRLDSPFGP